MYSPELKKRFANTDKGVVEEIPVVKLEDESAIDVITLLNLVYQDANQAINGKITCRGGFNSDNIGTFPKITRCLSHLPISNGAVGLYISSPLNKN